MPCTAHTTGFHSSLPFGDSNAPGSVWFQTSAGCPNGSVTSSPAENARSPAARTTTARTPSSALTTFQSSSTSSHICRLNAFMRSGRFSVIVATPLAWSAS